MGQKVLNKRSVQVVNNGPKLPTSEQLEYGELAINYADGHETLAIKNNQNEIVPFSSDESIYNHVQTQIDNSLVPIFSAITDITSAITDDEFVVSTALNDLNSRINTISGDTYSLDSLLYELSGSVTDNYMTSSQTITTITNYVDNLRNDVNSFSASIISEIEKDELVISETFDDINQRILNLGVEDEGINSNINALSAQLQYNMWNIYNSMATEEDVNDMLDTFYETINGNINEFSASLINEIIDDEYVVASALNELNDNINLISGKTYDTETAINAFSGYVVENYALSSVTSQELSSVENNLLLSISTLSGNAHSTIQELSGNAYNAITAATGVNLDDYALSANVNTLISSVSGNIESTIVSHTSNASIHVTSGDIKSQIENYGFSTKAEASEYAAAALANAIEYTDTLSSNTYNAITAATGINLDDYALSADVNTLVSTVSGNIRNTITAHTTDSSVHFTTGDVKTQIESYNYISGFTETDPTVPNWAKQSTKPSYTANEVGALPTGTTLDSVSDGSTRKLSDYATQANFTAHTASTSVHVKLTEKSIWNGKQDAISDLDTIRNNASSGATAYTTITGHTTDTTIHFTTGDVKSQIEAYGYTTNVGTITGIKMNGASKGSSGVVDLGTVITGETQLSTGTTGTQTGNAITSISVDGHQVKITKETTFALSSNTHNAITGVNATLTAHTADTNVHVTTAQTNTWNGKQDAISDLQTIRNNASSGATAYTDMVTGVTAGGTNLTKTNKVVAIPSASSSTFGVIKVGNFLSNSNGSISVSTGTTNATVAVGNHTHSGYATTGNLDTLSSQTQTHIQSTALHLPTVSASDNGKILQVVNGAWALVTPVSIFSGSTAPDNLLGNNGDIYLQI